MVKKGPNYTLHEDNHSNLILTQLITWTQLLTLMLKITLGFDFTGHLVTFNKM